jgi:integrase
MGKLIGTISGDDNMTRALNRLTALRVTRLREPGMYADGGGLYLRVAAGGSKQWIFRYVTNGRLRDMGIGPTHTLTLAEARERATQARKLRLDGIDPIEHKRLRVAALKAANVRVMTFRQCADAFIASHEAGWRSAIHRRQWTRSLDQYVHPMIGGLPVHVIDTALVMKALEPLWTTIPVTAGRLRGRIESILDWAKVRGYRTGENPARWRGHLDHLLPAPAKVRTVRHHPALPYAKIGTFMERLREETSVSAHALEFLILTAGRLGEVAGATWNEIDLRNRVWTVPGTRMKSGKEHRVPLSTTAVALLTKLAEVRNSDLVFFGTRPGAPLSRSAVPLIAKRLGVNIAVHGFRSTFRDWAAEQTNFPREVAEMALAHRVGSDVERAYQRSDLFEKRRELMEAWAQFCAKPTASGAVVAFSSRR